MLPVVHPWHLKARIVELEVMIVVRKQLSKHFLAEKNAQAAIELLYAVFSMRSVLYQIRCSEREVRHYKYKSLKLGSGQAYDRSVTKMLL
jgi:hypothetical protein